MHLFTIVKRVACSSLIGYPVHRYIVSISVWQWTQLVVEVIMLPVSLGMYTRTFRALGPQTPQGR